MSAGKRTDGNHAEIRDALRLLGYVTIDMSHCGQGIPDLLVADKRGRLVLLEVKTKTGKLHKQQVEFFNKLKGYPVHVVRSLEDAMEIMQSDV